ncbi:MAG: hypothetical protein FWH26_00770 [Oscillospiraceae bacterium]|nr:hypothetical protein [Oscillospiraceae bacterium]
MRELSKSAAYCWERALLALFPRRCVWCGGVTEPDCALCCECEPKAPPMGERKTIRCGDTREAALLSVFPYQCQASRIFLRVKFQGERQFAPCIGYTMAETLRSACLADKHEEPLFCAVPMTARQIRERGYNQSQLMAKSAARWLGAEFTPALLRKERETGVQHNLPASLREKNVAGAFSAARPDLARGRRVVLCDDVTTTGATLRSCARVLYSAGAAEVICLAYLESKKRHIK